MKLSDAVELGGMLARPGRAKLLSDDGTRACGIGMALLAVGESRETISSLGYFRLGDIWPWVATFGYERIYEMFDSMHRAAEMEGRQFLISEFADWLRSVEPPEPAEPEPLAAAPAEQQVEALQTVPGPNLKL